MLFTDKLNTLLSIMYEQEGFRVMTPEMVQTLLTKSEFKKHARKLVIDRYAVYIDKDTLLLSLTSKGSEFIRKGGYKPGTTSGVLLGFRKRDILITSLFLLLATVIILLICFYRVN
ncbi:MAG: hypothetical protein ACHQRM_04765 [Bacteroidia bacterium]